MSKHNTGVVFVKVLPNAASTPPGKLVDVGLDIEEEGAGGSGQN